MKEKTQFELINKRIIICAMQGVYSTHAAVQAYKSFRALVEKQSGPFAIIMDLANFEGSTPEGYQEAERFNNWLLDYSLVTKVNIIAKGITQKIVDSRIPTRRKLQTKEFATRDEAIAYVNSQLAD